MYKYELVLTSTFKKDYKKILKRHLDPALLNDVVELLQKGEPLPEKNNDHALSGN